MGCWSIARSPPALSFPVPIYTPGWKEVLWDSRVLLKNTRQWSSQARTRIARFSRSLSFIKTWRNGPNGDSSRLELTSVHSDIQANQRRFQFLLNGHPTPFNASFVVYFKSVLNHSAYLALKWLFLTTRVHLPTGRKSEIRPPVIRASMENKMSNGTKLWWMRTLRYKALYFGRGEILISK